MKHIKLIFFCTFIICIMMILPVIFLPRIIRKEAFKNIQDSTYNRLKMKSDSIYRRADSLIKINLK